MEQEKIKEIVFNKEIAQVETELAVFWELISSNLPQSIERSILGDSKIFYAFKGAYPEIKNYIRQQTLEEVIVKIKEKGLHLGYKNNIVDELQALKDKNK